MVKPRVGVRPAHEGVDLGWLAIVMTRVERLQVTLALSLRAGQRDLGDLSHLGGPSPQRLDELAKGEAPRWLRPKAVIMGRLHGPVY